MRILAIDPGQSGAFVCLEGDKMSCAFMPLKENKDLDFKKVQEILDAHANAHVFLERANPSAMGISGAFNYGRAFAGLEIAIQLSGLAVTYVEPAKWTKLMHEGISSDLKAKAKSLIAVERLFPHLIASIPKTPRSGKLHDGVVDALLIAGYGARTLGKRREMISKDDF